METILTIQQQIQILKLALEYIKCGDECALCVAIRQASIKIMPDSFHTIPLSELIPLFTFTNAEYFGANKSFFWWPIDKNEDRVKFLNWMIKQLEKDLNT